MRIQRIIDKFYKYLYLILFLGSLFVFAAVVMYQRAPARHSVQPQDLVDAWNADYRPKKRIHKKHEQRCRLILETMFRAPFPSVRPDFLRYTTGKNLELDGYNESLGLAFEYQGIQHRKYCPGLFHRDYSDFVNQQERDAFKKRTCESLGVRVIYIPDTVPYDSLWDYLEAHVRSLSSEEEA